ncbi:MAG: invasion associated locus B family protein [Hyphomicrobiales bacterium]
MAQSDNAGKGDAETAPADAAQAFGPRAGAQAQGQARPQIQEIATRGAWKVQCTDAPPGSPEAEAGKKACGMIQQARSDKNEKVGLSVVVSQVKRDGKTATFMRLMAPIGVYLPGGIPIEIDGTALPNRMVFTRCIGPICEAMGEASPESLAKFKKGSVATFYLYDRPGNGYPLKISLDGFGAGLADLDKL